MTTAAQRVCTLPGIPGLPPAAPAAQSLDHLRRHMPLRLSVLDLQKGTAAAKPSLASGDPDVGRLAS